MSRKNRNRRGWRPSDGNFDPDRPPFESTRDLRRREQRARREEREQRREAAASRPARGGNRGDRQSAFTLRRDDSSYTVSVVESVEALSSAGRSCGSCRNWQPDGMPGGRGACEHPGSGFLNPYADTPACPFYDR